MEADGAENSQSQSTKRDKIAHGKTGTDATKSIVADRKQGPTSACLPASLRLDLAERCKCDHREQDAVLSCHID